MAKSKVVLPRRPPKRTLTKQQAVRHLIHAAARMLAAREDPFAIHLLIQSADKLLIDLSKKTGRKLAFEWGELIKPEYRDAVINGIRETSNFFKHADKDHESTLHVGDLVRTNLLQIAICAANYNAIFGKWTDHMKAIFSVAKVVFPNGLVPPDQRSTFETALSKIEGMTLAEYMNGWWDDSIVRAVFPSIETEKAEDLQDTRPLYDTRILAITKD